MAIFKCKMCGGTLNIREETTVAECEFCGTKQTVPKLTDEKRANLYDRANHFRRINDYDKAMALYEQILNEDRTDAEAYWSIVLCRYGIEYVEDPTTHRRIPTVNRAQFTSILADEDYHSALLYADGSQRELYEAEAKEIDRLQREILAISQREKPFDVFICYKETGTDGARTKDSVLAQDLYFGLKNEGFHVFFSRITLEDKLGSAYEPYIFAALNSARVMVVLGTKPEYFNAVWVKNEWSRFLALMRKGETKTLIPAYKDMDPYDLPDDFSHLQALDMSKLGFMQDLVRGIKKILEAGSPTEPPKEPVKEAATAAAPVSPVPLLKRARLFLEDGDWESANRYCEKVLDTDPECGEAYFLKLLAQLRCANGEALLNSTTPIDTNPNYIKAVRFSAGEQKKTLEDYAPAVVQHIEELKNERRYTLAAAAMSDGRYDEAIEAFEEIRDYKDVEQQIRQCRANLEEERKQKIYSDALARVKSPTSDSQTLADVIATLQTVSGYADTDLKIEELRVRLAGVRAEEEQLAKVRRKRRIIIRCVLIAAAAMAVIAAAVIGVVMWHRNDLNLRAGLVLEEYKEGYAVTGVDEEREEYVIPATYRGKPVIYVKRHAFLDCATATEIVVPDSVRLIGEGAFSGCRNLQSMTLPFVGESADAKEASPETLFGYIFGSSPYVGGKLAMQYYEPSLSEMYYIPQDLEQVTVTGGEILRGAFFGCTTLVSVTLPDGITGIEESTFYGCASLDSVTIPAGVKSIGGKAFYGCTSLSSVTIPDSVTSIEEGAFSGCSGLRSLTVPFAGGNADAVNGTPEAVFGYIFGSSPYEGGTATEQFYDPSNSEIYYIPDTLKEVTVTGGQLSWGVFSGCAGLTSVTVSKGATNICGRAFFGCASLTSFIIPRGVTSIEDAAFYGCSALSSVVIPGSVTVIGYKAFHGCTALTHVYYMGQEYLWDLIHIADSNSFLTNTTRYYYSLAKPPTAGNYWYFENDAVVIWYGKQ